MSKSHTVTIYSTNSCHFCHEAKNFFNENKVAFTDHNVGTDLAARQEMIQKSGQMGVPVIVIDNQVVVGYDQEKLKELLGV